LCPYVISTPLLSGFRFLFFISSETAGDLHPQFFFNQMETPFVFKTKARKLAQAYLQQVFIARRARGMSSERRRRY